MQNSIYSKRQKLEILRAQLDNERQSFTPHWRDLGDYILPRRPRFYTSDVNKGDRRNQKIIDSTATLAARTLRSGMMSGVTSPARPWFRLTTPDPELAEFGSVKNWLFKVQQIISTSFLKSNLYNVLPTCYGDLGVFATAPISIEEDFLGNVMQCSSFPVGSYKISKNELGIVDIFDRDFRLTVRQLVTMFGQYDPKTGRPMWELFSQHVKNLWDTSQYEQWIDVAHTITPNEDFDPRKMDAKFKKYSSCYYEVGTGSTTKIGYVRDDNVMLRESGYDVFPILCPRWEVTGEDVYGTSSPGMEALGDIKQLQLGEKRSFEAIEKMIRPPMVAPTSMKNQASSILPGDITYTDIRDGQQGFRPAHEVNFRINEMEMKQEQIRQRINRAFYADLFLMLASSDRRQITAREIDERHEEKLLALGPVLEQLNQDLLDPLIDIAFNIHAKQGLLPPPPEELQDVELKIEYISIMAQAQKLVGIGGIERFSGFVGQVAQFNPEVLDKLNTDQAIDVYADITSVPPGIVRTDEEVDALRQQRMQAQQAQQQMQMAQQAAGAAKDLSQTEVTEGNALGKLLGIGG